MASTVLSGLPYHKVPCQKLHNIRGVFLGSIVGSEVTAAAIGLKAGVHRDPFAMLPFCGYNMADYFSHWINIGKSASDQYKLPRIFNVNWFRKDVNEKFLWPGYGDNIRVLKWIFERLENSTGAVETPIGYIPEKNTFDFSGLDKESIKENELFLVDQDEWAVECSLIEKHYANFKDSLPIEMTT